MPRYEFICPKCNKEVSLFLTMKERESGSASCPDCQGVLDPVIATFYSKTSRKS